MASISNAKDGTKIIQFKGADGKRKTLRFPGMTKKQAQSVAQYIQALNVSRISGQPVDDHTAKWLAGLDELMIGKLAAVGLVQARESAALEAFVSRYIESRKVEVKPNTIRAWKQALALLVEYFGADKPLRTISANDGKDFRLWLIGKGLADASVRKYCGYSKHFLNEAVSRGLLQANPLAGLVSSSVGNDARQQFVTREEIQRVIEACPDPEWRLIVALSRYGGLRCPSEHLQLRWGDIDWSGGKLHPQFPAMLIRSPKTEGKAGHEQRIVPLFPELLPYLREAAETAPDKAEFVISRHRSGDDGASLRTQMRRIVKRAGLKPWPRIFHNLRSSRQSELVREHPLKAVCSWIGNSPEIAARHYLQATEQDFGKAACAANALQHSSADRGNPSQPHTDSGRNPAGNADNGRTREIKTGVDGNRTHQTPGTASRRF